MPSKTVNRVLIFTLGFMLAVPPGFGQSEQNKNPQPGKDPVALSGDAKVLALTVTVRDKHGAIVKDLTKDDFTLLENGRPQTVAYFSAKGGQGFQINLVDALEAARGGELLQETQDSGVVPLGTVAHVRRRIVKACDRLGDGLVLVLLFCYPRLQLRQLPKRARPVPRAE